VLDPAGCPPLLTTVEERAALAAHHGVATTVAIDFTPELSTWSAERFCDRLVDSVPLRRLIFGPGFALGKDRAGNEAFLRTYGAAHGFDVVTVDRVIVEGGRVSSGRVRSALLEGRLDEATALLGRWYRLPGTVAGGDGRGRTLGFPTANVLSDQRRCVPASGVYATWLHTHGRWLPAATSIGTRPTFGGRTTTVEAFVLDFDGDLYDAPVALDFVARLREERAYPDAEALIVQMHDDVAAVRELLATVAVPPPLAP
jgi:riboflavin kinase/FMN adenylyltransferase